MSTPFFAKHTNKLMALGLLVIVCLVVLLSYVWSQVKEADEKLFEQQFNLSLINLSQNIDARIASMKLIAKTVANDTHIQTWVTSGFAANQESILVDKLGFLVSEYGLTSASFADKNTHKYWNHEGFLRILQPETDTWYFAYLASGESDLVSVYHDRNKHRVDVYVNYQQPYGDGLSGIATSFDGVLEMLNESIFAEHGETYLVNGLGEIQVHAKAEIAGTTNLHDVFSEDIVNNLLQPYSKQFIEVNPKASQLLGASYIPSMNWYVVAYVTKADQ
jgi:methyl-accepting chemotaxis protein